MPEVQGMTYATYLCILIVLIEQIWYWQAFLCVSMAAHMLG